MTRSPRLSEAMAALRECARLAREIDADENADPRNESPEDMHQHLAGLMLREIRKVLPDA